MPVVISVGVRQGAWVDSVRFNFTNGISKLYSFYEDGNGGRAAPVFMVSPGEYISEVRGRAGDHLHMIQFVTQGGRTSSQYGGQGGVYFDLKAPAGKAIVGLRSLRGGGNLMVFMILEDAPVPSVR